MADPSADDLAAARSAAAGFCGWHVTPDQIDTVVLDGPGSPLLMLPTLKLLDLTSVTELDVDLDVANLSASVDGRVRKKNTPYWQDVNWFGPPVVAGWWTDQYSAITVTMTHGFTDEEAADFEAVVRSCANRFSLVATGGRRTAVGPFQYELDAMASSSPFTVAERAILERYRLASPA